MPQAETLWECCDMCGWSSLATHAITFTGGPESFPSCQECAEWAVLYGYGTAEPIEASL